MHLRTLITFALLFGAATSAVAEQRVVIDASGAPGPTGGAKIAAVYRSQECRQGCIIDATKLTRGADLDLDGFSPQNIIFITKPVEIRLGEGDYRLSGGFLLRAIPGACEGSRSGMTCVVGGMGLIGAGSGRTRLHFTKDLNRLIDRRLIQVLSVYEPNRVPDLFAPQPTDNAIAGRVILPGSRSFTARDPAQTRSLQPGTWILVGDMHRHPANGASDFQHYEWKQVAQAKGATVRVTDGFTNTYNTIASSCSTAAEGCDRAYWVTLASFPVGPKISGLSILDETMSRHPTALYISGAAEPELTDVRTQIGAAAGAEAFALRLYRTLRPRVNGFNADGAGTRIEVSHAIGGRFSGIRTWCPPGPVAAGFFISVDFGSTANVFNGNATNCGSGFLVVEAGGNMFTRNTITAPAPKSFAGPRSKPIGTAGFAVYGGKENSFQDNEIEGLASGLYVADYPAGQALVWTPRTRVQDGSCVRPPRKRWLFFCTRLGGVTGLREPNFARALAGMPPRLMPVSDQGRIKWVLAGSVHPSAGSRFEGNRLTGVPDAVKDNSAR